MCWKIIATLSLDCFKGSPSSSHRYVMSHKLSVLRIICMNVFAFICRNRVGELNNGRL